MGEILTKLLSAPKQTAAPKTAKTGEASGWPVSLSPASELKVVVVRFIPDAKLSQQCGSGGVGKSAFTIQFVSNHFVEDYDPTIEDSYRKQQTIDDTIAMLEILDTAGQEEFSAMRDQWFRQGDAFILLYNITLRTTFEEIQKFYDLVLKAKDADRPGPMILVGNKADLESQRQVTTMEGKELAKTLGIPFMEASAKTRLNVEEAFFELVRMVRRVNQAPTPRSTPKK